MTELIVGEDGIFAPDLEARTELPMSQDVYVARGGTLPRAKPHPIVRELSSDETIDCGDSVVRTRAVMHAQPILECLGYRLEDDGASFAYSGDAGPSKTMEELAADCDVLVHMCHFISGKALNREFDKRNMGHRDARRTCPGAQSRRERHYRADGCPRREGAPDPRDVRDLPRKPVLSVKIQRKSPFTVRWRASSIEDIPT